MSAGRFSGQAALITAAGAGIGRAVARLWAEQGGVAVLSDRSGDAADAVAAEIVAAGGRAYASALDVRDASGIEAFVAEGVRIGDGIDVLFNVAGTNLPKTVEDIDEDEWQMVMDTNLTAIFRCCKRVIPHMRRRGGGAIVNVASIAGVMGEKRCSAYSASKGGVVLLTRNMAMDFAGANIRVNAICPGSTRTPRIEGYWARAGKPGVADCPMGRYADPEEIARPALFLASSDASYITGAALVVDGGLTAGFRIASLDTI